MAKFIKVRIHNTVTGGEDKMLLAVEEIAHLIESKGLTKDELAKVKAKASGTVPPSVGTPGTLVALKCGDSLKVADTIDVVYKMMEKCGVEFVGPETSK